MQSEIATRKDPEKPQCSDPKSNLGAAAKGASFYLCTNAAIAQPPPVLGQHQLVGRVTVGAWCAVVLAVSHWPATLIS
jgi:hypothetical protein